LVCSSNGSSSRVAQVGVYNEVRCNITDLQKCAPAVGLSGVGHCCLCVKHVLLETLCACQSAVAKHNTAVECCSCCTTQTTMQNHATANAHYYRHVVTA
jgi:hypothetical protein